MSTEASPRSSTQVGDGKQVLVTVGTTGFDKLAEAVSQPLFFSTLAELGYLRLHIQHGSSTLMPAPPDARSKVELESFRYSEKFDQEVHDADLIISHAGSGSILESLRLGKKLIVVVNDTLADNHQQELGQALHDAQYLICCNVDTLIPTLIEKRYMSSLIPFAKPKPELFADYLYHTLELDREIDSEKEGKNKGHAKSS